MKFLFDSGDVNYINKINECLENKGSTYLFMSELNKTYWMEFQCLDIAKANNFILEFMRATGERARELEDITGIHVKSLCLDAPNSKKQHVIEYLKNIIEELENDP